MSLTARMAVPVLLGYVPLKCATRGLSFAFVLHEFSTHISDLHPHLFHHFYFQSYGIFVGVSFLNLAFDLGSSRGFDTAKCGGEQMQVCGRSRLTARISEKPLA